MTDHTEALAADADSLNKSAEEYYKLAESKNFDYEKLMKEDRDKVQSFVKKAQADFRKANPDYEEMEGVVAGTPSLADYDVIIDAGSDASDPENAVPFSIKTPQGKTYKQPGNLNFLVETTVFGTEDKFQAKDVKADLNGDGKVEFGEAVPNADFYLGTTRTFKRYADELNEAAKRFKPNNSDAFTSLVVMTPTMSEYFEAWKNSRFIAGSNAKETAFVAVFAPERHRGHTQRSRAHLREHPPDDRQGRQGPGRADPERADPPARLRGQAAKAGGRRQEVHG